MFDVFISINSSASKRNGIIVVELYYSKGLSVSKTGKYKGGTIHEVDISNSFPVDNIDLEQLISFFCSHCKRLSVNAFAIDIDSLKLLVEKYSNDSIVFIDNFDKSLMVINSMIFDVNESKKKKYSFIVGDLSITYIGDGVLHVYKNSNGEQSCFFCEPTPRLLYDNESHVYSLCFDYYGTTIPYSDKALTVLKDAGICLRNYDFEQSIAARLLSEGFNKLAQCRFLYSGRKNRMDLNCVLSSLGIMLEYDENVVIPQIHIVVCFKSTHLLLELLLTCHR